SAVVQSFPYFFLMFQKNLICHYFLKEHPGLIFVFKIPILCIDCCGESLGKSNTFLGSTLQSAKRKAEMHRYLSLCQLKSACVLIPLLYPGYYPGCRTGLQADFWLDARD